MSKKRRDLQEGVVERLPLPGRRAKVSVALQIGRADLVDPRAEISKRA
jgi:hypothetical protein